MCLIAQFQRLLHQECSVTPDGSCFEIAFSFFVWSLVILRMLPPNFCALTFVRHLGCLCHKFCLQNYDVTFVVFLFNVQFSRFILFRVSSEV